MKVYRYLTEEEFNKFKDGDLSEVGSFYDKQTFKGKNTHRYKEKIRYLHFYKNKNDIEKVQKLHNKNIEDYYICTFDMPSILLIGYMGYGYYDGKGYDCDHEKVVEFAIPTDKIRCEYLISHEFDQTHHDKHNEIREMPVISFESNKF